MIPQTKKGRDFKKKLKAFNIISYFYVMFSILAIIGNIFLDMKGMFTTAMLYFTVAVLAQAGKYIAIIINLQKAHLQLSLEMSQRQKEIKRETTDMWIGSKDTEDTLDHLALIPQIHKNTKPKRRRSK